MTIGKKARAGIAAGVAVPTLLALGSTSDASESVATANTTDVAPASDAAEYSPNIRQAATQTNLYWGDTHLHTNNSPDSYMLGTHALAPEDAFRFARGEERVADNGTRVRLRRPLDFLVVSDHAEYLGVYVRLVKGNEGFENWEAGRRWGHYLRTGNLAEMVREFTAAIQLTTPENRQPNDLRKTIWQDVARTADRFNDPENFTAFVGFEWTSMPGGDNLHRVVVFRDGFDKAGDVVPFSAQDSTDPEDLWKFLRSYEERTKGHVLAIPHNGNVSNGRMFSPTRESGAAFTAAYARERARWEPVVEVTQIKGDGEAHPYLSPTDEFADFETWDKGNITMAAVKQPSMLRYEYARSALQEGLRHERKLGMNPFSFGVIGSTDSHTALSTATEDNFWGKFAESEPSQNRFSHHIGNLELMQQGWELGASGLAAVWARENTREALFDAIKRREIYATTGSRIRLRFFGGWQFGKNDVLRPDYADIGYSRGVPMGGDIKGAHGKAPQFMIVAAKDPDEANLDRMQVIKGWIDAKGVTHEMIYDVALSDGRKLDPKTGKAPPVGNTVDVADASYSNSIGDPELATVWTDPDFDSEEAAFYYVRVLEIPKPRWTAYDAKFFKVTMGNPVPMTIQDRAYSSPIWYHPRAR